MDVVAFCILPSYVHGFHLYITKTCEQNTYDTAAVRYACLLDGESMQSASREELLKPWILCTRAAEKGTNWLRCSHSQ